MNLVRSGTKQPQSFSASAEGRARHLSSRPVRRAFLFLRQSPFFLLVFPVVGTVWRVGATRRY
ncbi:hypothetical protein BVI434_1130002 [Burkholderia vietnamiensis]|nr:hypothetical protein BVI434_1130002 [Burkholderia vietnamiensis]